ncbi:hypothetical protein [Thalassospira lucentensis]|uniref:hypothetical protein n=1 Tax=Thalassospira lucentensis TaxID=168935 RepID=UPI003AA7E0CC
MAAWLASGGAGLAKTVITMDDQGVELQAAMLTRSPQTCYSIGRDDTGLSAAAYTHSIECRTHFADDDQELSAAQGSHQFRCAVS